MRQHLIMIFVCSTMFLYLIKSNLHERAQAHRQVFAKDSIDVVFDEYEMRAKLYLSRSIFTGTPMTGEMLALCARRTWQKYGTVIPVELALAQAQLETKMGTGGRKGHRTNPYNLGEWADRTTLWYKTTEYGVQAYYDLLARRYLANGKTVEDLYISFRDKDGYHYALPEYGQEIKKHVINVKRWININLPKERV